MSEEKPKEDETKRVAFDYIKSTDFRTMIAEGVIGGITPQNKIHCAFYAERHAIAQRQFFKLEESDSGYKLGAEDLEKQISRNAIIREMSCDLIMTPEVAESVGHWLLETVKQYKEQTGEGQV